MDSALLKLSDDDYWPFNDQFSLSTLALDDEDDVDDGGFAAAPESKPAAKAFLAELSPQEASLCDAVDRGDLCSLKRLVEDGADPLRRPLGRPPLWARCVMRGFHEGLEWLLHRHPDALSLRSGSERTPLAVAAFHGNLRVVKALLPLSQPDAEDARGDTALTLAAAQGWIDVVRELAPFCDLLASRRGPGVVENALGGLAQDAFQGARETAPQSPGFLCEGQEPPEGWSRRDRAACFDFLADALGANKSANPERDEAWAALAIAFDRAAPLGKIAGRLAPSQALDLLGQAIESGSIECARLLIASAPLRSPIKSRDGELPLRMAVKLRRMAIVEDLLRADPDLARQPSAKPSALAIAMEEGWEDMVQLLLPHSRIDHRMAGHSSLMDEALLHGHWRCAQLVLDALKERHPQAVAAQSVAALHLAIMSGHRGAIDWVMGAFSKENLVKMLGLRFPGIEDYSSAFEIALARREWSCAAALLLLDERAALNDRDGALSIAAAQSLKLDMPEALTRSILDGAASVLFCSLTRPGRDAFGCALGEGNHSFARLCAQAALAREDRPKDWESRAWRAFARVPAVKNIVRHWNDATDLFLPWLRSLDQGQLDAMLLEAAQSPSGARVAQLRTLLSAGAHVDARGVDGITPLGRVGDLAGAQILLDAGADPLACLDSNRLFGRRAWYSSPLGQACEKHNLPLVEAMLARLDRPSAQEPLICALWICVLEIPAIDQRGDAAAAIRCAKALLDAIDEPAPWFTDCLGRGLIIQAARRGQPELVDIFLGRMDPAAPDDLGLNALAYFLAADGWERLPEKSSRAFDALLRSSPAALEGLDPDELAMLQDHKAKWAIFEPLLLRALERQALSEASAQTISAGAKRL